MHRKSLEAAEQLKDQDGNSDHEETTSMRTEASDTSASSSQPPTQQQPLPQVNVPNADKDQPPIQNGQTPQPPYPEDPEAFRNNSIACLRAKAQEHSAKLLNHNLMLHARPLPQNCDANANNLHHPEVVSSDTGSAGMFWQENDN